MAEREVEKLASLACSLLRFDERLQKKEPVERLLTGSW
jgi:hypothetical protein